MPILRMYDVDATKRFYVDYLGFVVDWEHGEDGGPTFMRVSRGPVLLHLSSHHGDGTPGSAVVIRTDDVEALQEELHATGYRFMHPGIEPMGIGRELKVIDPAANELRFFQPG